MKKVYVVEYSDYGDSQCFGTFTCQTLAEKICHEANEYFKNTPYPKEVSVQEIKIFDENDTVYRFKAILSIETPEKITVETIAPTYQPIMLGYITIASVKQSLEAGFPYYAIMQYGATEQEAKTSALNFYHEMQKHDLVSLAQKNIARKNRENQLL